VGTKWFYLALDLTLLREGTQTFFWVEISLNTEFELPMLPLSIQKDQAEQKGNVIM
jgi:hypothetical protein